MRTEQSSVDLRSARGSLFQLKVFLPLLLAVPLSSCVADGKLMEYPVRLVFMVPSGLVIAFCLSLASLRVRNGRVRYKRFFHWITIDAGDIVSSGVWWADVGFIEFEKPCRPWGKLFFVLDTSQSPLGQRDRWLLRWLNGEEFAADGRPEQLPPDSPVPFLLRFAMEASDRTRLLLGGGIGVLLVLAARIIGGAPSVMANGAPALAVGHDPVGVFLYYVNHPTVVTLLGIVWMIGALRRRHEPNAIVFAALGTYALTGIVVKLMLG